MHAKKLTLLPCLLLHSHFSFRKYLMNFNATDVFVCKTYLKFLQLIFMILLKPLTPLTPKAFAVFFDLKLSGFCTKESMNYSILKKWRLKLLCSPGSTSLFFQIPFTGQVLKYAFHIHILVANSWTIFNVAITSFIPSKVIH